jgi:hypothetical protein
MKSKFAGALVTAVVALGAFAGAAGASNHGASGIQSVNSIYNSDWLGTCNAAYHNSGHSDSYASAYWGYPGWFGCGGQG